MSDTATAPVKTQAPEDSLRPLDEKDLFQLDKAFSRHMRDPSTVPGIMRQFFLTQNMLIQRVKNLEARLKATDRKSPPPASSKTTDDLSNV